MSTKKYEWEDNAGDAISDEIDKDLFKELQIFAIDNQENDFEDED